MSFLSFLSPSSLRSAVRLLAARVHARRQQAHQRIEMRGMSDHELKDLGLGRSEVQEWLRRSGTSPRAGTDTATEAPMRGGAVAEEAPRTRAASPRAAAGLRLPAGSICA